MGVFKSKSKPINVDLKPEHPTIKKLSTFEVSGPNQVPDEMRMSMMANSRVGSFSNGTDSVLGTSVDGSNFDMLETNSNGQLSHVPAVHMEKPALSISKVAAVGINMQQCQSFLATLSKYRSCMEALISARRDLGNSLKDIKRIGTPGESTSPAADTMTNTENAAPSETSSALLPVLPAEMVTSLEELSQMLDILSDEQFKVADDVKAQVEKPLNDSIEQWVAMIADRRAKNQIEIDAKTEQLHKLEKESYKKGKKSKMSVSAVQDSLIEKLNLTNEMQALEADSSTFHDRLAATNLSRIASLCSTTLKIEKKHISAVADKMSALKVLGESKGTVATEPVEAALPEPTASQLETSKLDTLGNINTPPQSRAETPEVAKPAAPQRPAPSLPAVST